jgi:hypothetical protein
MNTESKLREALHTKFRELGYTTNSQTAELLDVVFEALAQPSPPDQADLECPPDPATVDRQLQADRVGLVDRCKKLVDNMRLWVDDAVQHNNEYVPVHRKTLTTILDYLEALAAQPATAPAQAAPFKPDWVNYRQGFADGQQQAGAVVSEPSIAEFVERIKPAWHVHLGILGQSRSQAEETINEIVQSALSQGGGSNG